jgi:ABC-type multidrug transport system fused ATPase/permease subunit
LLEGLLKHLANGGPRWIGVLLALALAASSVVQTLAINAYFHVVFRLCAQVKTSIIGELFDKALRIDSSEKASMGVGTIVNLQSNDAAKLYKLPQYLHMLWSAPFQIMTVMIMLIRVLHPIPALVGLAVTVALIPLSSLVARALARARTRIVKLTDERVKLSSEVILGIKAIKLYAWEVGV